MDTIKIHGGVCLRGKVRIQGSKNASLPILAAVLMTDGETVLQNVPKISDVYRMLQILKCMGCSIRFYEKEIRIRACYQEQNEMPAEAVKGMRSSICLMGALLGKAGRISMEYPGGCVIGARPIDLHMDALRQMGVVFEENSGKIEGHVPEDLHGAEIYLSFPSVGATENIVLAGVLARGRTILHGAAREPEIRTLCAFLNCCGARIQGMGTDTIIVDGVECLRGCRFCIPGDRIVAGTYMLMTAATGGCSLLEGVDGTEVGAVISLMKKMGCDCQMTREGIYVQAPEVLQPVGRIVTAAYPGFPTDLQSVAMVAALKIPDITGIEENIFENRFQIVPQMEKMGASVWVQDARCAWVTGGNRLNGCPVEAKELRGGAALVTAGLLAGDLTTVTGCCYIDRGYENICKDLRELGARIYRGK